MPTSEQLAATRRRRELNLAPCCRCGMEKPWSEFEACVGRRPFNLSSHCRSCDAARKADQHIRRRVKNPELVRRIGRAGNLKKKFGLSIEQYERMHQEQLGLCAICGEPEKANSFYTGRPMRLAVDHNKKTGEVRALLCSFCNRALGGFMDSERRLGAAIEYLRKYGSNGEVEVIEPKEGESNG